MKKMMKLCLVLWRCGCGIRTFASATRPQRAKPPFNILFFGTDNFALETLQALHINRLGATDARVVDRLDVVSTSAESAVAQFARKQELALLHWPLELGSLDLYDLGVLVSFGRLVSRKIISAFPYGILNVHPSLLPRWRGASPIIHTILNNDTETAISIMSIQATHFDTGPIIQQKRLPVPVGSTSISLASRLGKEGADMLEKTLHRMPDILQKAVPQAKEGVTYAHKASPHMALINWQEHTCLQIKQQYRALGHKFFLRTTWSEQPVKLADMVLDKDETFEPSAAGLKHIASTAHLCQSSMEDDSGSFSSVAKLREVDAGTVVYDRQLQAVCIKCLSGWVAFRSVILRKKMSATDFYNGYLSKDKHRDVCLQSHHNGLFDSEYQDLIRNRKAKKS